MREYYPSEEVGDGERKTYSFAPYFLFYLLIFWKANLKLSTSRPFRISSY